KPGLTKQRVAEEPPRAERRDERACELDGDPPESALEGPPAGERAARALSRAPGEDDDANEDRQRLHVPSRTGGEDPAETACDEAAHADRRCERRQASRQHPMLRDE